MGERNATVDREPTFFGHPRGLATLFFTEVWERFSFYGMRAILILFMTAPVAVVQFSDTTEKRTAPGHRFALPQPPSRSVARIA